MEHDEPDDNLHKLFALTSTMALMATDHTLARLAVHLGTCSAAGINVVRGLRIKGKGHDGVVLVFTGPKVTEMDAEGLQTYAKQMMQDLDPKAASEAFNQLHDNDAE